MRHDLPTLAPAALASVTGGASKNQQALTLAMNQLKSAMDSLKEQASSTKSDSMLPMMMMMMMGGGGGGGGAPAPAPAPEPAPAPAVNTSATCICGG